MSGSGRTNPFINRQPLTGGGREHFLARVRKSLGREGAVSPAPTGLPPERDERVVRQVAADDPGRVDRWVRMATANTMRVQRVAADAAAVTGAIAAAFSGREVRRVIVNAHELDGRFGVAATLAAGGKEILQWGAPRCAELAFECDAAVTDCRAGLADTGAVMVWSDAGFGRSSTLVVPLHVVLLPASRVLGDLVDGMEFLARETGGQLPSNVIIINGPSKTADIEMNLVTGVHGPKYVYVILISDL